MLKKITFSVLMLALITKLFAGSDPLLGKTAEQICSDFQELHNNEKAKKFNSQLRKEIMEIGDAVESFSEGGVIIGIGRSPSLILGYIRHSLRSYSQESVIDIPFSKDICSPYHCESFNLPQDGSAFSGYFERVIEQNPILKTAKDITVVDYSLSGDSLSEFVYLLKNSRLKKSIKTYRVFGFGYPRRNEFNLGHNVSVDHLKFLDIGGMGVCEVLYNRNNDLKLFALYNKPFVDYYNEVVSLDSTNRELQVGYLMHLDLYNPSLNRNNAYGFVGSCMSRMSSMFSDRLI